MRPRLCALVAALLVTGSASAWLAARAPSRVSLDALRVDGTPLLDGFVPAAGFHPMDAPRGAAGALCGRFCRGSTELSYDVTVFPSVRALKRSEQERRVRCPMWWPADGKVHVGALGPGGRPAMAASKQVVNRMVIEVRGFQDHEMLRRDPESAKGALSEDEMVRRVTQIASELARRARDLPANRAWRWPSTWACPFSLPTAPGRASR